MEGNLNVIYTTIGCTLSMIGLMIALFLWIRGEANQDRRMFYDLMSGMKDEMKDFHGRLCAIEERNRK